VGFISTLVSQRVNHLNQNEKVSPRGQQRCCSFPESRVVLSMPVIPACQPPRHYLTTRSPGRPICEFYSQLHSSAFAPKNYAENQSRINSYAVPPRQPFARRVNSPLFALLHVNLTLVRFSYYSLKTCCFPYGSLINTAGSGHRPIVSAPPAHAPKISNLVIWLSRRMAECVRLSCMSTYTYNSHSVPYCHPMLSYYSSHTLVLCLLVGE
jgi:hypothetical protein